MWDDLSSNKLAQDPVQRLAIFTYMEIALASIKAVDLLSS